MPHHPHTHTRDEKLYPSAGTGPGDEAQTDHGQYSDSLTYFWDDKRVNPSLKFPENPCMSNETFLNERTFEQETLLVLSHS